MQLLLSSLPLLLLIALSLFRGVQTGVFFGFLTAVALFFARDGDSTILGALSVSSAVNTLQILFIVFGALLLHSTMMSSGRLADIQQAAAHLHPNPHVRFFLIASVMTCFFEGVAGFGTPGALVPPILVSLGYPALLSVTSVLLFDALFVLFGAVGAPIILGLQEPLQLSEQVVANISAQSALLIALSSVVIMPLLLRAYSKETQAKVPLLPLAGWLGLQFLLFLLCSFFVPSLASILAAFGTILALIMRSWHAKTPLRLRPWLPYAALLALLFLPKLPWFRFIKESAVTFTNLFGSNVSTTLMIGSSPLFAFILVSLVLLWQTKGKRNLLPPVLSKTGKIALLLFPLLMLAKIMAYTPIGGFSMVAEIGQALASFGQGTLFLSPFLGALGTFVAGSATVSNIMLAPTQIQIAQQLGTSTDWVLSLQTTGAALGNAICLFNIIAACAIVHLPDYRAVLQKTFLPIFLALALVGLVGSFG